MSYSDDLDWLARNAKSLQPGKWVRRAFGFDGSGGMKADGIQVVDDGDPILASGFWHSSDGVIARRAELQNKPSWDKAPVWAIELAQDSDGKWFFYADTPTAGQASWRIEGTGDNEMGGYGAVLGDWRDTLEQRPEIDMSAERVQETEKSMSEDIEDVLELAFWKFDAARSKSGEELICFKNKARWLLENYGGRGEPEHDAGWHERGVLPPAGIRCEAEFGGVWELVYVVGRDSFDRLVIECADGDLIPVEATNFRPIRTERDQLVDVLCKAGIGSYALIAADAILAAGFKREGGAS